MRLAALDDRGERASVRLFPAVAGEDRRLKIYKLGGALPLSDAVPVLENFGFRVIGELPTAAARRRRDAFVHDFVVEVAAPRDGGDAAVLEGAIAAVLEGRGRERRVQPADRRRRHGARGGGAVPRLVPLSAPGGAALRPDHRGRRAAPRARRSRAALIERFAAAHDPDGSGDIAAADAAIERGLDAVSAIDDDRILRAYRNLIAATLRTNAFAAAAAEALAFKLDSHLIPGLPAPVPWREIWVYSPARRGHPPARRPGRARRPALVRPPRRFPHRDPRADEGAARQERGDRADRRQGRLLSQAASLARDRSRRVAGRGDRELPHLHPRAAVDHRQHRRRRASSIPRASRILDGEDPYFVVAADKGTATFCDVANALALERGFWLGDAFASGGSVGYDHKAMGITAKGAWVSVQRHFAERGVDVQTEPITVVGCGDMSGDVFGNGMLLSKTIRLVAAFDHRHIFLDPDPDPAASWDERARLFALPRSSWADYDAALISTGGGVFARTAKIDRAVAGGPRGARHHRDRDGARPR